MQVAYGFRYPKGNHWEGSNTQSWKGVVYVQVLLRKRRATVLGYSTTAFFPGSKRVLGTARQCEEEGFT